MRELQLTQGQVAFVDDDIYESLLGFKWYAQKHKNTFYVSRNISVAEGAGKRKLHHEVIGKPPSGFMVDHIDGNGLNNTRENLRFVTNRVNQQNQVRSTCKRHSQYPGVSLYSQNGWTRWVAGAKINGKRKTIGYFDTEILAYQAYLNAISQIGESS